MHAVPGMKHEHEITRLRTNQMSEADLLRITQQFGYLTVGVQRYYLDMGLRQVDPDSPLGSQADTPWQLGCVQDSGNLAVAKRELVVARRIEMDGKASNLLDGICGVAVLRKEQPCSAGLHTDIQLLKYGATEAGLGRVLLSAAMEDVHPEDRVVLDVPAPDFAAYRTHRRMGFVESEDPRRDYGLQYADSTPVLHVPMAITAGALLEH